MAINLNQNTDCCETSCDNTTVNTPGPQGPQGPQGLAGSDGDNGTNGKNGYSVITGDYLVPEADPEDGVNVYVDSGTAEWVQSSNVSNQIVYLTNIGHFKVKGKNTGGSSDYIMLEFLNYGGDPASPNDPIPRGTVIAPAGRIGPASTEALLTTKGQLLTATDSAQTALYAPIPTDSNRVLKNDDNTITGLKWEQVACSELTGDIDLTSQVTGELPLSKIETTGASGGSLMYYTGTSWTYLTPGAAGTILKSNGSGHSPQFIDLSSIVPTIAAQAKIALEGPNTATIQGNSGTNINALTFDQASKKLILDLTSSISEDCIVQVTSGSFNNTGDLIDCKWEVFSQSSTQIEFRHTLANATDLDSGVVYVTVFDVTE
jgi:hypothetical protein